MRIPALALALALFLAGACRSDPAPLGPPIDGGRIPGKIPLDAWPAHIDATPPPDAAPRPDRVGPDAATMPIATAPLVFWLAKERVEIPGNWLSCEQDSDCVTVSAHCAERTLFAANRTYADRAVLRADRPCRGQLIPSPPSVTMPRCITQRCMLAP